MQSRTAFSFCSPLLGFPQVRVARGFGAVKYFLPQTQPSFNSPQIFQAMEDPTRSRGNNRVRGRGRGRGRGRVRGRGRGMSTRSNAPEPYAPQGIASAVVEATNHSTPHVSTRTSSTTLSEMTTSRFDSSPISPKLHRAMAEVFKYESMTTVQHQSIPIALKGGDVLVKARTGTGKTIAFLLPTLHRALMSPASARTTTILVVSPTRELAQQIADEAKMLMTFMPGMTRQVVVGGTNIRSDHALMKRQGAPTVLVGTPGRLLDHLGNPASGFQKAVKYLDAVILDEADRLLDMGFAPDLKRIFQALPPVSNRQTLLFSATMPADVQKMAEMALKPDYKVVDCVGEEENTHLHVAQSVLVTPIEKQVAALGVVLYQCMQVPDYKIIVFFTTARQTQFCSELFAAMGRSVLEIHSRKSQGQRNKVSDAFRTGKKLIMFTSDVTARGLDYPDVSTVIQVGLPTDKEQYIHRIGRTARAGKGGSGVLLLSDFEAPSFKKQVIGLPLKEISSLKDDEMQAMQLGTDAAIQKVAFGTKAGAYQAWLGFYNGKLRQLGWTKEDLVAQGNHWATSVAQLKEPPALLARTVGKMGLKGIRGLRVEGHNGVPKSDFTKGREYVGSAGWGRGGAKAGTRGGTRGGGSTFKRGNRYGGRSGGRGVARGGSQQHGHNRHEGSEIENRFPSNRW